LYGHILFILANEERSLDFGATNPVVPLLGMTVTGWNALRTGDTIPVTMVYHMYIMASESGVLYTGVTNLLERRVAEHKLGQETGFSKKYKTCKLVYFEPFGDIRNAIAREKQLKRWRRGKKVFLIEKINPAWRDLSEDFNG
jgi:putative endonuclease